VERHGTSLVAMTGHVHQNGEPANIRALKHGKNIDTPINFHIQTVIVIDQPLV
jgi:hypothetical protein